MVDEYKQARWSVIIDATNSSLSLLSSKDFADGEQIIPIGRIKLFLSDHNARKKLGSTSYSVYPLYFEKC